MKHTFLYLVATLLCIQIMPLLQASSSLAPLEDCYESDCLLEFINLPIDNFAVETFIEKNGMTLGVNADGNNVISGGGVTFLIKNNLVKALGFTPAFDREWPYMVHPDYGSATLIYALEEPVGRVDINKKQEEIEWRTPEDLTIKIVMNKKKDKLVEAWYSFDGDQHWDGFASLPSSETTNSNTIDEDTKKAQEKKETEELNKVMKDLVENRSKNATRPLPAGKSLGTDYVLALKNCIEALLKLDAKLIDKPLTYGSRPAPALPISDFTTGVYSASEMTSNEKSSLCMLYYEPKTEFTDETKARQFFSDLVKSLELASEPIYKGYWQAKVTSTKVDPDDENSKETAEAELRIRDLGSFWNEAGYSTNTSLMATVELSYKQPYYFGGTPSDAESKWTVSITFSIVH